MSDRPQTAAAAKGLMLDWAEGRRSHLNLLMEMEPGIEAEHRQETLVRVTEADAREVEKWGAVARALSLMEMADGHPHTTALRQLLANISSPVGLIRANAEEGSDIRKWGDEVRDAMALAREALDA